MFGPGRQSSLWCTWLHLLFPRNRSMAVQKVADVTRSIPSVVAFISGHDNKRPQDGPGRRGCPPVVRGLFTCVPETGSNSNTITTYLSNTPVNGKTRASSGERDSGQRLPSLQHPSSHRVDSTPTLGISICTYSYNKTSRASKAAIAPSLRDPLGRHECRSSCIGAFSRRRRHRFLASPGPTTERPKRASR